MPDTSDSPISYLVASTPYLWLIAILFFGLGDLVTTLIGYSTEHVIEVGPVVGPIIAEHGFTALGTLKLTAFAIGYALWRFTPRPHNVGVPLGLATLGVLVTSWNTWVLYLAT